MDFFVGYKSPLKGFLTLNLLLSAVDISKTYSERKEKNEYEDFFRRFVPALINYPQGDVTASGQITCVLKYILLQFAKSSQPLPFRVANKRIWGTNTRLRILVRGRILPLKLFCIISKISLCNFCSCKRPP